MKLTRAQAIELILQDLAAEAIDFGGGAALERRTSRLTMLNAVGIEAYARTAEEHITAGHLNEPNPPERN